MLRAASVLQSAAFTPVFTENLIIKYFPPIIHNLILYTYILAALVLLAISVLTPYFFFIPKSCLAAVIITAVIFMVETSLVKMVWKSKSM